jgi:hypothetical protein
MHKSTIIFMHKKKPAKKEMSGFQKQPKNKKRLDTVTVIFL